MDPTVLVEGVGATVTGVPPTATSYQFKVKPASGVAVNAAAVAFCQ